VRIRRGRQEALIKDKCGREITVGCVVDILADGMLSAFVVDIKEGGLVGANGRPEPATLVLQVGIPIKLNPGQPAPCYVVRESDKPKEEEKVM